MKLFTCQHCGQLVYFENTRCERCGRRLGFLPEAGLISALEPEGDLWLALAAPRGLWKLCANAEHHSCNWLVPADAAGTRCVACRHNRTIPDLAKPENLLAWQKIEAAKHRLFYTLVILGLPLRNRADDPVRGLAFDFLADDGGTGDRARVMTGHDNGVITLAVAEADDVERERRRIRLTEPYRTLLGHLRHEIGHYYWDRLIGDNGDAAACRAVFGDDRANYAASLRAHYANGAPADWQERFITAYASSHPWEDFAETWAHYFHIVDTLEMGSAFSLRAQALVAGEPGFAVTADFNPYEAADIGQLIAAWLPLTHVANNLNRCMGAADLYPFILSPTAIAKLGFIHELIRSRSQPS